MEGGARRATAHEVTTERLTVDGVLLWQQQQTNPGVTAAKDAEPKVSQLRTECKSQKTIKGLPSAAETFFLTTNENDFRSVRLEYAVPF